MAELEAITVVDPPSGDKQRNPSGERGVFGRRFPLPLNEPVTVGRVAGAADLAVPEDQMITGSPFHATLRWDGNHLTVAERDKPHKNRIRMKGVPTPPDAPPVRAELALGDWFEIGVTKFTLHADGEGIPAGPADGTLVRTATPPPVAAASASFANPPVVLAALGELSRGLRTRPNEEARVQLVLTRTVAALPRADAAGLVFVVPGATPAEPRIGVREHHTRSAGRGVSPAGPAGPTPFAPSRRLVHQTVHERKTLTHIWSPGAGKGGGGSGADYTVQAPAALGQFPWAICVPLQPGSGSALYVSGTLAPGERPDQPAVAEELAGYQKVVELMAGLLEMSRQASRLAEEKARFWPFVPKPIREHLSDPVRYAKVLDAREADVVVLFCDLRNFTRFLIRQNKSLEDRWREVAFHLHLMSTAVTVNDGVVCRVLGDAIMGFWGWPDPAGPDADRNRAAKAAAQIRSGISWFNQLGCGVGVACGRALVGKLGTEHLAEIDLYGPVVNLASRLQDLTKAFGVGVVVADEVAECLRRDGGPARTRRLGRVRPKGMEEQPCDIHELLPEDPHGGQDCSYWDGLVADFTDGRWDGLYEQLAEFRDRDDPAKIDPAARCLLREMDRHGRRPPPDWDGGFAPRPPEDEKAK